MNSLSLAFLMGLFGSLHCAVMCGPLMLSMPFQKNSYFISALKVTSYQLGRILVYVLLGVFVGWVGSSFTILVNQKLLSLSIGIGLVLFTVLQLSGYYVKRFNTIHLVILKPVSTLMGKIFKLPFFSFSAGMLNGLIPCGMVYLALATALNTASISGAASFMFLFGIGTMPLMLMITLSGTYLKKYIPFNTQKLIPWFMFFMGILLILRSADLGINFLSPITGVHPKGSATICN